MTKYFGALYRWVFWLGLAVMPLVFWPRAEVAYEIPRVVFFLWWVRGLVVLLVLGVLKEGINLNTLNKKLLGLMLFYGVVVLLTAIWGVDWYKSLLGNFYRMDGLLTLSHLMAFGLVVGWSFKWSWRKGTAVAITLGVLLTTMWTLVQGVKYYWLGQEEVSVWNGAIGVSFGQPNFLAGYVLVAMPFLVWTLDHIPKKWEWVKWMVLVVVQVAICLTQARAGLLGLGLFWLGYLLLVAGWTRRVKIIVVMVVTGLMLISGWYGAQTLNTSQFVAEGRERIYYKTWLGIQEKPWWGYGYANVNYAFEAVDWPIHINHDVYVDKAHGHFLEVWATSGVVGLASYLALTGYLGMGMVRRIRGEDKEGYSFHKALLLVLSMFVIHSQTNVISINEEMMYWLVLGIMIHSGKFDKI